jgi:hypothetical protein
MDLTDSYKDRLPAAILAKYSFAETRNATAILSATNPAAYSEMVEVLSEFQLRSQDLIEPGGQESALAARINEAFRSKGWREARADTLIQLSLVVSPWGNEAQHPPITRETKNEGYKVDNFRHRVALDVEWNAKDGNLDRDISAYRALYDAGLIDIGILLSRTLDLRELAEQVALDHGMTAKEAKKRLQTTTTTNDRKLLPRLTRGDAGGCPVLAIFIAKNTYVPSTPG